MALPEEPADPRPGALSPECPAAFAGRSATPPAGGSRRCGAPRPAASAGLPRERAPRSGHRSASSTRAGRLQAAPGPTRPFLRFLAFPRYVTPVFRRSAVCIIQYAASGEESCAEKTLSRIHLLEKGDLFPKRRKEALEKSIFTEMRRSY